MKRLSGHIGGLWCWHQHGWRHLNHEVRGKKQEFGPARTGEETRTALMKGWRRLESVMGESFVPVFTPPWNRCDGKTLRLLLELGYRAVSRFQGSQPLPPGVLPDIPANVDLHTRREADGLAGRHNLLSELQSGLSSGRCGVMIHHRRMNDSAFGFLEDLLACVVRRKHLELVHFRDLMGTI